MKLFLLLWKNWLIQRRQIVWTFCELFLPTLLSVVLVILRQQVESSHEKPTVYSAFNVSGSVLDLTFKIDNQQIPTPLFHPNRVLYSPNTIITNKVINNIKRRFFEKLNFTAFDDEDSMVNYLSSEFDKYVIYTNPYLGGIVFDDDFAKGSEPKIIEYKIRLSNIVRNPGLERDANKKKFEQFNINRGWNTKQTFPILQRLGPRQRTHTDGGKPGYWREGFLTMQRAIDVGITEFLAPSSSAILTSPDFRVNLCRFPYPSFTNNPFINVFQRYFPLVILVSLSLSVLYITRNAVQEKELRLKEYMRSMGLGRWINWFAHFISNFLKLSISVAIITILLTVRISGDKVIDRTDPSLIFVFLLLFASVTIWFSFAISTFFKKGNTAAACGGIVFFLLYVPYFFLQPRYGDLTFKQKMFGSLSFNTAMAFGVQVIGIYEGTGMGLQWHHLFEPGTIDDNLALGHIFAMLIVDLLIMVLITWYVDTVYPGDQGVPQKLWFPFKPSYWYGGCVSKTNFSKEPLVPIATVSNSLNIEQDPPGIEPTIWIQQLSKIFKSSGQNLLAVDNLNQKMYSGQISALLGHNGAGKSTTVSILTGLLPASSGTAIINGYDLNTSMSQIRHSMGLCPQYNALYDNLTVLEHLKLFCKLKGRLWKIKEVNNLVNVLGLVDKQNALAHTLSGGMKRKLAVAIALIGGSEIVILDEPTSGMDPGARHQAWTLLQKEKRYRTILLTTHYMEEADLLADRIAILAKGRLQCSGSSLFLKNKYGSGYHLTVLFSKETLSSTKVQATKLLQVMKEHCGEAELETTAGLEATYLLPAREKEKFQTLFAELEIKQQAFNVSSFGISITTMEEVFLRVTRETDENNTQTIPITITENGAETISLNEMNGQRTEDDEDTDLYMDTVYELKSAERLNGFLLWIHQIKALIIKRLLHSYRNWMLLIVQFFIPVLFVFIAIMVNKLLPGPHTSPPLNLNLDRFLSPIVTARNHTTGAVANEMTKLYNNLVAERSLGHNFVPSDVSISDFYLNQYKSIGLNVINNQYVIGAEFSQVDKISNLTAYFNNQPWHGPGIALNMIDNAILRYFVKNNITIRAYNHPLPPTNVDKLSDWLAVGVAEFNIAFNLVFGMAFLTSTFVVFLIKERESKSKHLQLLSGVHPFIFWFSTYVWDIVNYIIPAILIIVLLTVFHVDQFIGDDRWMITLLLFILYGWAVLPLMYAASFFCNTGASGFVKMTVFNIVTGLVTFTVTTMMYLLDLYDIYLLLVWIFMGLFPNYCLAQGLNVFYMNQFLRNSCLPLLNLCGTTIDDLIGAIDICCGGDGYTNHQLQWEDPGMGRQLFFLACHGIFFWFVVFLIEMEIGRSVKFNIFLHKFFNFSAKTTTHETLNDRTATLGYHRRSSEDDDVTNQRTSITEMTNSDALLIARNLTKFYGNFKAVNEIDFYVKGAECFGLLGVNGAGKTTTFQMLTGENFISKGSAFISGINVRKNWRKAGRHIGYCPQFDAVIEQMTGYETLAMFARLRGVTEAHVKLVIKAVAHTVGIEQYLNRLVGTYSGGNKRRLSLGMALVGLPDLLLLDEPTTGVDPAARRAIWNLLARIRNRGTAIVLTSHSMEECESLCTKLAIMVAGRLKCLGSLQHIKSKYGTGYNLQLKIRKHEDVEHAMEVIAQSFRGAVLKELHHVQLSYEIPRSGDVSWSRLFAIVESLVDCLGIIDYSLSQTTLEQVFLSFAKEEQTVTDQPILLNNDNLVANL